MELRELAKISFKHDIRGIDWKKIKNKPYPRYSIASIYSNDGLNLKKIVKYI